ncbi:hypothetical protein H5410_001945 [Solanum commersonii]|uniref:Uncharacterized protein n=1 Tax=Solanum commersonii TaxID=4109 RepID=A0A9J6B0N2_SOLCO|nr:hypothetical protein H5410_001945 [Solanum commersonii]
MEATDYQIGVQTTRHDIIRSNTLRLVGVEPILDECIEGDEGTEIISNPQHDFVAEDQVYLNNYYLKCSTDNCSWNFKSSRLNKFDLFKVRKFCETHTCTLKEKFHTKRQSTSSVLGAMLVEKLVDTKTIYTPTDIRADMLRTHGISLTYM